MLLAFGPLRYRLEGSSAWLSLAKVRYAGFLTGDSTDDTTDHAPGADPIPVVYRDSGLGPSPSQLRGQLLRPPMLHVRDGVWHLSAPGFRGRIGPDGIEIGGPLATYPLDSVLIAAWSLAGHDAVVVHGALLADGDDGWLCTGPSGVGKSTLAALLPERALCDELVGVRRETLAGGESSVAAYGLPFWRGRPGRAALAGVHFLRHGGEHRRHALSPARAFARLRSQVLWPGWSRRALDGAFRTAAALAGLPCHVLDFLPDRGVWHHVRQHTEQWCLAPAAEAAA